MLKVMLGTAVPLRMCERHHVQSVEPSHEAVSLPLWGTNGVASAMLPIRCRKDFPVPQKVSLQNGKMFTGKRRFAIVRTIAGLLHQTLARDALPMNVNRRFPDCSAGEPASENLAELALPQPATSQSTNRGDSLPFDCFWGEGAGCRPIPIRAWCLTEPREARITRLRRTPRDAVSHASAWL
ncbi:MAG: hypothetical protein RMJ19_00960, partial [Gemmatales bacterium]|nr:hypothetical protein [Gemmatales bacterium]MDW8174215.1 hypothetical protein [Gemmatales bacterium]